MKRTTCFRKKAPKWDFHFAATYKVMSAPKASEVAAEDVNDGGAAKDVPNRFVETENTRVDDRIDVPTQCHCHFAICMLLTDADGGQRKQMLLPELAVFMSEGCRRANERTAGKTWAVNTPEHACGSYLMVIKVCPARPGCRGRTDFGTRRCALIPADPMRGAAFWLLLRFSPAVPLHGIPAANEARFCR